MNGLDVVRRNREKWLIDFGDLNERDAAAYQLPYELAERLVKPFREGSAVRDFDWWRLWGNRPELAAASKTLGRVIVTPEVAKHRAFVWVHKAVNTDKTLPSSPATTTRRLASCIRGSMRLGRCGSAHGSASETIRDTRRPPPSRPSPSRGSDAQHSSGRIRQRSARYSHRGGRGKARRIAARLAQPA